MHKLRIVVLMVLLLPACTIVWTDNWWMLDFHPFRKMTTMEFKQEPTEDGTYYVEAKIGHELSETTVEQALHSTVQAVGMGTGALSVATGNPIPFAIGYPLAHGVRAILNWRKADE